MIGEIKVISVMNENAHHMIGGYKGRPTLMCCTMQLKSQRSELCTAITRKQKVVRVLAAGRAISTTRVLQSGRMSVHNFHVLPKCHTLHLKTERG